MMAIVLEMQMCFVHGMCDRRERYRRDYPQVY